MKSKVVITGMGAISPIGNDVSTLWQAIKDGKSGVGNITLFDASAYDSRVAAEVKDFDASLYMDKKDARKMARFTQFAVAASVQAWLDAGMDKAGIDPDRVAIMLGNGIGGIEIFEQSYKKLLESGPSRMPPMTVPMMIMNEAAGNIAMRLNVHGFAFTQVTACASGTDAIGLAMDMIRSGRADVIITGGCEAAISTFSVGGFCMLKALSTAYNDDPTHASRPFDKDRDGFVIGEGAGIFIIESEEHAKKRGARIHAELAGYGASCDAYHLTGPHPEGVGGVKAIKHALTDAGIKPEEVQYYNAHGTSTQMNDPIETKMIKAVFGDHARKMKVSSTKGSTGHLIAAAGAIEAIICVKAIQDSLYPPTINLKEADPECDLDYVPNKPVAGNIEVAASGSLGFGGHNGVLVIRKYK
ncbi:MAG: beta-ketoacyl-[acyl-carrier-protein] synthase II [Spirochaetes bacterium GWD1_61_31]|nr:MAG: beta-ketoacyl-[acyl-carrier-protein] synthase II [Spirochaetes bacterium GWB1_60_80]OHD33494.1 MAG: beta-ketoacyl-[acyl-carrier-protein] synthase II [Spirochaetes bacterium GWC1_61_12]OHD36903.1 MAG: beta-ketoacyl-[acyl-carrier-protein] synthase II [Spirochaetes bacterium GWD1_61_31]OHD42631.1 MAG: beta-ketoacyl-[acyl-carrier-protein] synthase II [Spirochaetes bacterium GWE1_60_18]OHD58013.1 MAG: beta-ketoacyl-[acyl-carrier-protein] synthase II [Spirochaetes bacterium GWF1_60_12]HAP426